MAYIINRFNGTQLVVLEDGTLNTSTSLGLLGRNYTGYGEVQNENFLFLLENFANSNPPSRPITGQTWYNVETKSLNIYDGTEWGPVGSAFVASVEPTGFDGSLWYKPDTDQLHVYESGAWKLIGPEGLDGFGATKIRSKKVLDIDDVNHPILEVLVNDVTLAVMSATTFTLNAINPITGFEEIKSGITISSSKSFNGTLDGNAFSATRLQTPRDINGVSFNGQSDITIKASTTNSLIKGTYISGSSFDGSSEVTWSVDASPSNIIGKVVARDSAGDFEAGTITADLIGNVTGNVTAASGTSTFNRIEAVEFVGATLSGNALTASRFETPRKINGVDFDGSQDVTVPVLGTNVTGNILASNVQQSSLTSLGTLTELDISVLGNLTFGGPSTTIAPLVVSVDGIIPKIKGNAGVIKVEVSDTSQPENVSTFSFINSTESLTLGGPFAPALVPDSEDVANLGISTNKWNNVHANYFYGIATSAQYADLAENYVADASYEPGTVLEFGGEFEVTLAEDATSKVAGVVTTNPAYLMNSDCKGDNVAAIALQGRTPCKVRGNVEKGDMLISAGSGFARSCRSPQVGTVIGKALEAFNGIEGIIEVAVGRI
jgi:hypothetical protein